MMPHRSHQHGPIRRTAAVVAALTVSFAGAALTAGPAAAAAPGVATPTAASDDTVRPMLSIDYGAEKSAFVYLVKKGLSRKQAAGVIGNLDVESGMDPTIKQIGGGPGRGIAQWSTGGRWDTYSKDNQLWWTKTYGADGSSSYGLTNQLGFLWYELSSLSYYGGPDLKKTTTVKAATQVFMDQFERPASSSSFGTRYDYARRPTSGTRT